MSVRPAEERGAAPMARDTQGADRHWPALDGLRAIAVCAVIAMHIGVLPGGYLGVDIFFVLSGFLITSLLIQEWDKRGGTIRLRDFYARRALRLLPALGCVVAAALAFGVLLDLMGGTFDRSLAGATFSAVPWVLLFAGNLVYVFHPGVLGWFSLGVLSHTWSLAIEEQFYLVWPSLFLLAMRRGLARSRLALLLATLAVAEMIYRVLLADAGSGPIRIYYGTDTHSDGLLLGCALAFWLATGHPARLQRAIRRICRPAMWLAAGVLLGLLMFGNLAHEPVQAAVAVLASGVVITGVALGHIPAILERLLCSRLAVRTGRHSYGLYLWHPLFVVAAEALAARWTGVFPSGSGQRVIFAAMLAAAVISSIAVAGLSYRYLEVPAQRLKRRFQMPGPGDHVRPVAATAADG